MKNGSFPQGGTLESFEPLLGYGFLIADSGERVLCHVRNYCSPVIGPDGAIGFGAFWKSHTDRELKEGDQILFKAEEHGRGLRAKPWTYFEEWEELFSKRYDALTAPPVYRYRVMENIRQSKEEQGRNRVLFEGSIGALNHDFPRLDPSGECGAFVDCAALMRMHFGNMEVRHSFERQRNDGEWRPCEDPRSLVTGEALARFVQRGGRMPFSNDGK